MTEPIPLTPDDIAERLTELYRSRQKSTLVAFYGDCEEQEIDAGAAGRFRVRPVRSELHLRELLPPPQSDERIAFVLPWAGELPLDVARRFARGRIHKVGREKRLMRLFGVQAVDPELLASPLADHVLNTVTGSHPLPEGRLTLEGMWSFWLQEACGFEAVGGLAVDTLLAWVATNERIDPVRRQLASTARLREALTDHLEKRLGTVGPLLWEAWEAHRGRRLMEMAIVLEAVAASSEEVVRTWIELRFKKEYGVAEGAAGDVVAQILGAAAGSALRLIRRRDPTAARALVTAADALLEIEPLRRAAMASPRLPSAWNERLGALGEALREMATKPAHPTLEAAIGELRHLERHEFFTGDDHKATFTRAEMAVRLAAWLLVRPDRRLPGDQSPYADALRLGRWYAEEGGYVDWARHEARRTAVDTRFGRGVHAVVEAADAARRELDLSFAAGLKQWHEARRPAVEAIPIDAAVRRIAVKFLKERDDRRLLVLLMDGMGWAQAVQLLRSLKEETSHLPWKPLAWHRRRGRIGEATYPVVLAALPSITEVSRAAFFRGRPLKPGEAHNTAADPKRWARHRDLRALSEGREARLFARDDGFTADGTVRPEALTAIRDRSQRIVALVVNAIDSWLKSDPQQHHDWTADAIHTLRTLLAAANESGRVVMLASDHGHVPGDRLVRVPRRGEGGARWRVRGSGDEVLEPWELGLASGDAWAPAGVHGVVLLADDEHGYGSAHHSGEHGGATLAEVVCPTLLLGNEELEAMAGESEHSALALCEDRLPGWWLLDVTPAAPPEPADRPSPPARRVDDRQLRLELESSERSRIKPLADSEIFKRQAETRELRGRLLAAVEYLLERHGVAASDAFANAMGEPPYRAAGLVSQLSQVLNYDQYQVLRHDGKNRQVRLNKDLLEMVFEVKL